MRKLRVGVWLTDSVRPQKGGAFSYYNELARAIREYSFKSAEIVMIDSSSLENLPARSRAYRYLAQVAWKTPFKGLIERRENNLRKELRSRADVIYYLTPNCPYTGMPYIYTHWDIGHMSTYAFPEFSQNGNFEYRKREYDTLPHKALAIFAPSNEGKKECKRYLNINDEKIHVVPIFPSGVVRGDCQPEKPRLIEDNTAFIHYSAQYWAHKNHYHLVLAFAEIRKKFPGMKLVLTGSDKGNKDYIFRTIRELGLERDVIDLGFASLRELRWLYEHSRGLVMPTFLGTVNMPLLEAAELGCPVASTDMPGHRELLGEYGYYFDPTDSMDIASKVIRMIEDGNSGTRKDFKNNFTIEKTFAAMDRAFAEIGKIRSCWD